MTPSQLLRAYDTQLRTDGETPSAIRVERRGPLRLVTFTGGRGFVTYRDLGGAGAEEIRSLVAAALEYYRDDPQVTWVEWKSRDHDHAPGLHEALVEHRFVPEDAESIMLGELHVLVADDPLPAAVALRRVTDEPDVRAMSAMQDEVFGSPPSKDAAAALLRGLARKDGMDLWVAEADGQIVSAGRLEPVAGSDFAGI